MKHYVDATGRYLGGWQGPLIDGTEQDHPDVPADAVEVPGAPPAASHMWDGANWAPDLAARKAEKKEEIRDAWLQALASGYTCSNGIKMDATAGAIHLFESGVALAKGEGEATMDIVDYNDVPRQGVAIADAEAMVRELRLHFRSLLLRKASLRAQVDAATTIDEVDAVTW